MQDVRQTEDGQQWLAWDALLDLEVWIDTHNRELQLAVPKNAVGYGSAFRLTEGGDIFMHTTGEGDILLDLTPEAQWVAPVVSAATGVAPPRGQIWVLPAGAMLPLLMGLSSLIAASRLVLQHEYRIKKSW